VIGSVVGHNTVNVQARVGGELTRVAFAEGQNVRQGDLLFTIDPRPFDAALQAAVADSARDAAKAVSAQSQVERYSGLIGKDYVTKQEFEDAKASAASLQATLQSDLAALKTARLNLSFCYIRAPISGRTGNLLVREGNLVKPNDVPLVVIQQIVPVFVEFSVPEQRLPEIRKYAAAGPLRVQVAATGDSATIYEGTLTLIDNAVNQDTGTILLKATFPNQDESLWPGQFVNVSLILTTWRDAVIVPAAAVQKGQQGDYVFVIKPDQSVAMQPVDVTLRLDDSVVIGHGVRAGDRVVTDGQLRLSPGAKVSLKGAQPAGVTSGQPNGISSK